MKLRAKAALLLLALTLAVLGVRNARADEPFRFLVMGDPQFQVPREGAWEATLNYGYEWQSPTWKAMPRIMDGLDARYFFVCGDIFQYQDGDGATAPALWDVWDKYLETFAGVGRVEWITGGHEFWGSTAAQDQEHFVQRYPDHVRYTVSDAGHVFILFDDVHSPHTFDTHGLEWLERTLKEAQGAEHVWFFGHVPPRNTADWWPTRKRPGRKDEFRSRMAALLGEYGVRAAFFGHEHRETYLGDRGGFPMFVTGVRHPLLVEVRGERVEYRWLMDRSGPDLLRGSLPVEGPPLTAWRVAALPEGAQLPDPPTALKLPEGLVFRDVSAEHGVVNLDELLDLQEGGKAIAVADYPLGTSWGGRCARIRSSMPYSLWINGRFFESADATAGRFNGYQMALQPENRVVIVFDVEGPGHRFTFVLHSFPDDMRTDR